MKRLFIVHGWGGSPSEPFYQDLKRKLEPKSLQVNILEMPSPLLPDVKKWVPFLKNAVDKCDDQTYFYGHSIGSQTILRYVQGLRGNEKAGGAVFTSGFIVLNKKENTSKKEEVLIDEWLKDPLDFNQIKKKCKNISVILSDNDPYVPLSNIEIFKKMLNAKVILEHDKGHSPGDESLLTEILELIK